MFIQMILDAAHMVFILVKAHLAHLLSLSSIIPQTNVWSRRGTIPSTDESAAHGWGSWRRDTCDGHRWLVHNSHITGYSSTYNADNSVTIFRFMNTVAHLTLHDFLLFFSDTMCARRRQETQRFGELHFWADQWRWDQKWRVVAVMRRE